MLDHVFEDSKKDRGIRVKNKTPKPTSAQKGNAGEHYANWLLHERGFRVYMADRNNPDHDMLADYGGKVYFVRVKTTTNGAPRWAQKKNGRVFNRVYKGRDFVLILDISRKGPAGLYDFYVVPTPLVEKTLRRAQEFVIKFPTRKGGQRKDTSVRTLVLTGFDTETNISRGFEWKWQDYRNSFAAIFSPNGTRVHRAKGPVYRVWQLCNRYQDRLIAGTMTRPEFLALCVKKGVNRSTAAVQYAAWLRQNGI